MANPRRAPLFWRWGLARRASRNSFPGQVQSFCGSLPRARFRRFGSGGWSDGLPGILDGQWPQGPFYQPEAAKWPDLEIRAADGRFHTVPYKEFISGQAEPFLSRACRIATLSRPASRSCRFVKPRRGASLALASVILALGAGPLLLETGKSGFPKQFSERRPKLLRQPPSCSLPSWGGRTGFPKQVSER